MKVSVVVPALNEEKMIERTLKSIRAQDYPDKIELIVADGVSKDRTVKIARKYCDKVVVEKTRTIAAGRQKGTRASHGDIVLYTDADGWAHPDWVKETVKAFKDENVVVVFGMIIPENVSWLEEAFLKYSVFFAAGFLNFIGINYVYGNNMAVRRSTFERVGGFDTFLVTGEDTDIVQRLRKHGKVVFAPKAVIRYSIRRIRKWGYWKYFAFHTINFFKTHISGEPAKHYEVIRE